MPQNHASNWKHHGSKNELLFMAECMKRGWKINMPFGDDSKYDVIVDTPTGLRRIQVKSCHKADSRGRYRISMRYGKHSHSLYSEEDCDLIAAFVAPLGHWFLVPVTEVKTKHLDLAHHHHNCLEAWHHVCDVRP